jgi:2'-5' RNA ligase
VTRYFLALWPDEATCERIAEHQSLWRWPAGARVYRPEDWHVTLHFIGALEASQLTTLSASLPHPCRRFVLTLDHPELWPHGLAVLGADQVPEGLLELHQKLGRALQAQGLNTDIRPYRPHLTLARHADGAQPPPGAPSIRWSPKGYSLVESTGEPTARYRQLRSCVI